MKTKESNVAWRQILGCGLCIILLSIVFSSFVALLVVNDNLAEGIVPKVAPVIVFISVLIGTCAMVKVKPNIFMTAFGGLVIYELYSVIMKLCIFNGKSDGLILNLFAGILGCLFSCVMKNAKQKRRKHYRR